jgi:hypothetical protein
MFNPDTVASYFDRYEWAAEPVEANVWLSRFATDEGEEFDLYVLLADDWLHMAVSPFLPRVAATQAAELHTKLLQLNQQMKLVRFGLDDDGDVNLLVDLPVPGLSYALFAQAMNALIYYTNLFGTTLTTNSIEAV